MDMLKEQKSIEDIYREFIENLGFVFWGVEMSYSRGKIYIYVYIEHEKGVTVEDCIRVNKLMTGAIYNYDAFQGPFVLEVSSPGVWRKLFTPEQYLHYSGAQTKVITRTLVNKRKHFYGTLQKVTEKGFVLEGKHGRVQLTFDNISKAQLHQT